MLQTQHESNTLLVVVDNRLLDREDPVEAAFLKRAILVAEAADYDVDLFYPCHDLTLSQRLFQSDPEVRKARSDLEHKAAASLAEIAMRLRERNIECSVDVHVDEADEVDAILNKIEQAKPALVIKQAEGRDYILGLLSNTDWDLTRRSSRNIWFVPDTGSDDAQIDTILTAIGNTSGSDDIISETDYEVYRTAEEVRGWFDADNIPVHAYEVPEPLKQVYNTYAPLVSTGPQAAAETPPRDARRRVAEEHGSIIRDFAGAFGIDPDEVKLVQGHPVAALPQVADSTDANLLIMGARDLARWERIVGRVTAEPVLAKTACDVLFVKTDSPRREAQSDAQPVQNTGSPAAA